MRTYQVTLIYTTTDDRPEAGPDYWDWPELLDLGPAEQLSYFAEPVTLDTEHARLITEAITAD
jgi:hypothetical protein